MAKPRKPKQDPYAVIAEEMAQLIESSETLPWKKNFSGRLPRNLEAKDGKTYNGFNLLFLMMKDEPDPFYVTFNQARKLGGHVKKGAKSKKVCFFRMMEFDHAGKLLPELKMTATQQERAARSAKVAKRIPFLRYSNVYNAKHDCEGLEKHIPKEEPRPERSPEERHKEVMEMIEEMKTNICPMIPCERQPCYYPKKDVVAMPPPENFKRSDNTHNLDNYAGECFHEYAHATGHPTRLGRRGVIRESMNHDEAYAFEELVAEFASYLTLSEMGIANQEMKENSAAYIQGWAKAIRSDPKAFVASSFQAVNAHKYLMGIDREKAKGKPELMKQLDEVSDVPVKGEITKEETPDPSPGSSKQPEGLIHGFPDAPEDPPVAAPELSKGEIPAFVPFDGDKKEVEKDEELPPVEKDEELPPVEPLCDFQPLTEGEIARRRADFDRAIEEMNQEVTKEVETTVEMA